MANASLSAYLLQRLASCALSATNAAWSEPDNAMLTLSALRKNVDPKRPKIPPECLSEGHLNITDAFTRGLLDVRGIPQSQAYQRGKNNCASFFFLLFCGTLIKSIKKIGGSKINFHTHSPLLLRQPPRLRLCHCQAGRSRGQLRLPQERDRPLPGPGPGCGRGGGAGGIRAL